MSAAWWYANRAAGLVAWALLTASMVLGLLLSTKALGRRVRPNWLQDLHRGLSALSVAFVGVHVAAAIGDNYVHFGAADVLVPGASDWRPLAVAWGVVCAYLLVAVEVSSLMRARLPRGMWRRLHYLSFPLFITATLHAVTAGTEMGTTAGIGAAALATAAIAGLTATRITSEIDKRNQAAPPTKPVGPRSPAPAAVPRRAARSAASPTADPWQMPASAPPDAISPWVPVPERRPEPVPARGPWD